MKLELKQIISSFKWYEKVLKGGGDAQSQLAQIYNIFKKLSCQKCFQGNDKNILTEIGKSVIRIYFEINTFLRNYVT